MNLILLQTGDFISNNRVCLKGLTAKHIYSVHKAELGTQLTVGLINGLIGKGTVIQICPNHIELDIDLNSPPPETLPLTLIIALPRPKTLKKIIQVSTSMGVKHLYFIESWKVDKSYWQSPCLNVNEINKQIKLGLEQGKDTLPPQIIFKKRFKPFIEDEIPELIKDTYAMVAHPTAEQQCPFNINKPVTLIIGPEGGFTEYEINLITSQGFQAVSIGRRVLRTEYAIPAILGRLF